MKSIYGLHTVKTLLLRRPEDIRILYVQSQREDQRLQEIVSVAKTKQVLVQRVPKETIEDLVGNAVHQGVVAQLSEKQYTLNENDLLKIIDQCTKPLLLLILDNIQDPHNLGACLRTADAAGVHAVIAPKDNSVGLTPIVHKVASGAAETVPFIQVTNLSRTLTQLKERGIWLLGLTGEAETPLYEQNLCGNIAIVMGKEGEGLRRLTKSSCDFLLNIPMSGTVSSLNVSVATGVALFEAVRQRKCSGQVIPQDKI